MLRRRLKSEATREPQNIFISMTDLTISILLVVMIMLAFVGSNLRDERALAEIEDLERLSAELELNNVLLGEQLSSSQRKIETFDLEARAKSEKVTQLETALLDKTQELVATQQTRKKQLEQIDLLSTQLFSAQESGRATRLALNKSQSKAETLATQLTKTDNDLRKAKLQIKQVMANLGRSNSALKAVRAKAKKLDMELSAKDLELQNLQQNYKSANEKLVAAAQNMEDKAVTITALQDRVNGLSLQVTNLAQTNTYQQKVINAQDGEFVRLKANQDQSNIALEEIKAKADKLDELLSQKGVELQDLRQNYKSANEKLAAVSQNMEDKTALVVGLQDQVNSLSFQVTALTQTNTEQQKVIGTQDGDLKRLKDIVKAQKKQAEVQLYASQSIQNTLKSDLDEMRQKFGIVSKQAKELSAQNSSLFARQKTLLASNKDLKTDLSNANYLNQDLKNKMKQAEVLSARFASLQKQYSKERVLHSNASQLIADLRLALKSANTKIENFNKKLVAANKTSRDLDQKLEQMGEQLKEKVLARRALITLVTDLRADMNQERDARRNAQIEYRDFRTRAAAALGSNSHEAEDLIAHLNNIATKNMILQKSDNQFASALQRNEAEIELLRKQNGELRATVHTLFLNTSKIAKQLGARE